MIHLNLSGTEEVLGTQSKDVGAQAVSHQQALERLRQRVAFDQAMIVSTMPRGSLQVVQPQRLPDTWLRAYNKTFHAEDRGTWQAIVRQKPVTTADLATPGNDRYLREFVRPAGFEHVAVAPVDAPVLGSYDGAVHLYRRAEAGEFTQGDLYELTKWAEELSQANAAERRQRVGTEPDIASRQVQARQFVFDQHVNQLLPNSDLNALDAGLREHVKQHVNHLLQNPSAQGTADRVSLPDLKGDLWNFRVTFHKSYPALSDGPVVFVNLLPDVREWATLRPDHFAADAELSRMVPAMRFMAAEFARVPTLQEIAKTVHLSPFHFHRRFTELFGLTPKHFLLDCQIAAAKRALLARQQELAEIASACGFAHQSHFTSRFKQATGLTPTRWRRIAFDTVQA